MSTTLGSILDQQTRERFVGRAQEMGALSALLEPDGPRVIHLNGVAGVGKSLLAEMFAARARESGATVVRLDCRAVEPSTPGFLGGLARATGAETTDLDAVADRLSGLADRVVLVLDTYEVFWLMDTFIRREFCPLLGEGVRLLLVSRERPVGAWMSAPGWGGLFRTLALGPLTEREAVAYLAGLGLDEEQARRINGVVRGHPLGLTVASALGNGFRRVEDAAVEAVIETLAGEYLSGIDAATREALEAACVLRRTTEALLGAMLPSVAPGDAVERLRQLSFVEHAADGFFVHDAVRDAISTRLLAIAPERHRGYRAAAWHELREEAKHASRANLWRVTADILYLLQNPVIREGFFPSGYQPLAVEPAGGQDHEAIREIAGLHEGPEGTAIVSAWLRWHPEAFNVCLDLEGSVIGFSIVKRSDELSPEIVSADPVVAAWSEDLARAGAPGRALMIRRLLDRDLGEANSGSRGAFGLDAKRTYMEMRPNLRYIYLGGIEPENFDWCDPLGFEPIVEAAQAFDGAAFRSYRLDMGPGSVDGWLARLVGEELGIEDAGQTMVLFDAEAQELVLPTGRVSLTPLEHGLMHMLSAGAGKPVSRAELLEGVWGYEADTGSNVIEAVVASLRRKLGDWSPAIETVRGTGYRYRPPE